MVDNIIGKTCPYCQYTIKPDISTVCCSSCSIPHHFECWNENNGCTTFGCPENPANIKSDARTNQADNLIVSNENVLAIDDDADPAEIKIRERTKGNHFQLVIITLFVLVLIIGYSLSAKNLVADDESVTNTKKESSDVIAENDTNNYSSITWDSGRYTGELNDNTMPDGFGVWFNTNGDNYKGDWKNGKKHGQGTYIWADGRKYTGAWENDYRNGQGHWIYPEKGHEYKGEWKNGFFHGHGVFIITTAEGQEIYDGEYKRSKKHGYGTWTFPDGSIYEGELQDGKKHGMGLLIDAYGNETKGEWKDDRYVVKIAPAQSVQTSPSVQEFAGTLYNYADVTINFYINGVFIVSLRGQSHYNMYLPKGVHAFTSTHTDGSLWHGPYSINIVGDGWYYWAGYR